MVCDKVVCERWCVTKWCERWCVKDGVKDGVSKIKGDKVVCERWCVKDGEPAQYDKYHACHAPAQ